MVTSLRSTLGLSSWARLVTRTIVLCLAWVREFMREPFGQVWPGPCGVRRHNRGEPGLIYQQPRINAWNQDSRGHGVGGLRAPGWISCQVDVNAVILPE